MRTTTRILNKRYEPSWRPCRLAVVAVLLLSVGACGGGGDETELARGDGYEVRLPGGWNIDKEPDATGAALLIGRGADYGARPASLPADWRLCTNPVRGYAIGYPGGWHAEPRGAGDSCRLFDAKPFHVPRNSEPPYVALEVWPGEPSFGSKHEFAPPFWRVHTRERTSVAGRRALRVDATATGEGLHPRGMRVYAYVIDRGGKGLIVQTTGLPGGTPNRRTVDTAVRTLRFFEGSATPAGSEPTAIRDRANEAAPTRPVSNGAGRDTSLRDARDPAVGSCPRRGRRPAAIREGLVVPNRGAVGVYLGTSLPRVIGCLGSPLSRSDYGVLSYGAADGIFDVGVVANAVSSLNIAGKRFCLAKRICLETAGGVAKLRRRYGRDVRLTRDESGRRVFTIESTYRGRPVVTAIAFEGAGKLSQVMISWKHEGRPKAGPALLRQDGVGPLRLGMTRAAALATEWLAHRGKGCPLGGPPVPITYTIDVRSAPRRIRGVVHFVRGKLVHMAFSAGVSTAVGVIVGESTVAEMVSRYRKAGFQVTRRFEPPFQATFVTVTHNGEAVVGGFASKNVIELLSIPRTQGCD